ncbi:MAG: hypothetical protein IKY71_06390 [Bacteroidaceae bacterium]|nr:hypothetical protein [Bacteroidaceae bacterium]
MKASKIVFYISMAVSLAIIALFFFVGFGNTEYINGSDMRSPLMTDALLYLIYVLTILAVVLVVVFSLVSFFKNLKNSPKDAMKSLVGILAVVLLFVVAYALASDEPIMVNGKPLSVSNDGTPVSGSAYILTDVILYAQYVLFAACTLATVYGLLNITRTVKK